MRAAQATGDPYRFVIADYHMPGMDGATLASLIKADPGLKGTVVVILSSVGHWRELRSLEGGAVDICLTKPVRNSQLLNALAVVWSRRMAVTSALVAQPQERASVRKSGMAGRFADRSLRVLVVEDNIVNQTVARRMLERLGVRVDVSANGREAAEMVQLLPYDVVFMDCQMPEMNGYEATTEIRRREAPHQRMPIIAMTAEAIAGSREQCIEAGMDDFIPKPVKIEDLVEALEKWISPRAENSEHDESHEYTKT